MSEPIMPNISRRAVLSSGTCLGISALVLGSGGLTSCSRGQGKRAEEFGPYDVWRDVQAALRTSDDHTAAKSVQLVRNGDIAALHRFVRDEIRLVSFFPDRFIEGSQSRFGMRAALRSGAGTARDKAEIFADLARQTGLDAEIVEIDPRNRIAGEEYFRSYEQDFNPQVSVETFKSWRQRLGYTETDPLPDTTIIGDDPDAVARIETDIRSAMGDEISRVCERRLDKRVSGRLPVVKLTLDDGTVMMADVVNAKGELTSFPDDIRTYDPRPIEGIETVSLSIVARTLETPEEPIELVRAEWGADQLAGRQVRIAFRPQGETAEILASRVSDLRIFTPALSLQALDGEAAPDEPWSIGDAITLEGQHVTVNQSGQTFMNGQPVKSGPASGHASRVSSLEIVPKSGRFPSMELDVFPLDDSGEVVENLTSADFQVSDTGDRVGHLLTISDAAPSILFLADDSLSMPQAFRGSGVQAWDHGEAMLELRDEVLELARSIHPRARVEIRATQSNLWESLAKAVQSSRHTLIVYATDGDLTGKTPDEAMTSLLRDGPPVIALNVQETMNETRAALGADNVFDQMADMTGGVAASAADGDIGEARSAILEVLRARPAAPYKLSYHAASLSPRNRSARLEIGSVSTRASYTIPAQPAQGNKLIGLEFVLQIGKQRVARKIAGYQGIGTVSERDIHETHGALFGDHMIAFEGELPSISVLLDDLIEARLGNEPIDRVLATADPSDLNAIIEAVETGRPDFPEELATLLSRTGNQSGEDFTVTETGIRAVFHSRFAAMQSDEFRTRIDILSTGQTRVLAEDQETRLQRAFQLSIPRALAEAEFFDTSTVSLLKGQALTMVDRWPYRDTELETERIEAWAGYIDATRALFPHPGVFIVGPADGSVNAVWTINRATGEVTGLLPDLSGGGSRVEKIKAILTQLELVIARLNVIAGLAGASSVGMTMIAVYGQNLARLYAAASIAITLMDASQLNLSVRSWLTSFVCELVKELGFGIFKKVGETAKKIIDRLLFVDGVLAATGNGVVPSCPGPVDETK